MIETITLILLGALVSLVYVHTRGAWLLRASMIAAFLVSAVVTLWPEVKDGGPTLASPPANTRFAGCLVEEKAGRIFLWLVHDGEPHGYTQPYTRDLHEVCAAAQQAAGQGIRVGIKRQKGTGNGVPGQEIPKHHFRPYVLPAVSPPQKG